MKRRKPTDRPQTSKRRTRDHSPLADVPSGLFARRLIGVILAALILGIVWASQTPVDEVTTADGTIRTSVRIERLEHPDGGTVVEVRASPGQTVFPGDVLVVLDSDRLLREQRTLLAHKRALDGEWRRVSRTLEGADHPTEGQAFLNLEPEEQAFWAEQAHFAAQLDLIAAQDRVTSAQIAALAEQKELQKREISILRAQLTRFRSLSNSISRSRVDELERQLLNAEQNLADLAGTHAAQLLAIETNELRRTELLTARQLDAARRRAELRRDLVAATQDLAEIEARIDRSIVVAEISGTILDMAVSAQREVLAPGDLVAEIVPQGSPLQAEIEVSADRIGTIRLGMQARLRVASYDFTRFGTISGEVTEISPTSFETSDGQIMYRAIITLPDQGVDVRVSGRPLRPGMTITADVIADRKTVLGYLLKPLRAFRDRAFSEA